LVKRTICLGAAALTAALMLLVQSRLTAQAPGVPADIVTLLTRVGGFSSDDITALDQGRVITRADASPENLEASVVTAVRIATDKERTFAYFQQLVSYVDGKVTTGYGAFSRPPAESDVRRFTLDSSDLADLRACQPASCDLRFGTATPAEISRAVDWLAPDANERAQTWARQTLAAYAAGYVSRGESALKAYDEKGAPIDLAAEWRALFSRSPALTSLAPGVQRYLAAYPGERLPADTADAIYWDDQHYTGLKPIVGLTHMVTVRDAAQPNRIVVAQRQIFASHYLYGSLAVTLVQQAQAGSSPATYVVYFNRSRGDLLKGTQATNGTGLRARLGNVGASLQRRLGEQLIKDSAVNLLSSMKEALEVQR
jgi:hypothetical protein